MDSYRSRKKKRALSLVELIIGLCLFAIAIIPVFGIIPTAYMSIKKAEDFSAASCYAQEVVEMYRLSDPLLDDYNFHNEWDVTLNDTEFQVAVDLYGRDMNLPYRLVDVVVHMYWRRIPEQISVFTRVFYNN